ncbi:hypothetical protein C2G38_2199270 [Gigaspora rosea]|uniref:Uncharacterized protein n=1 Tax=Gigaspora rosea TaxID=44941 RepID=A0A397URY3_9GLOM|nr:hypothetical protein C2G38_2199270 [Gigaspora rosea]
MKGIYNLRAPKQKPTDVVDVLPTMDYIQSLGSNSEITILNLAQKMALLLALMSGSQPSNLQRIDLTSIFQLQNGISVNILNPKEAKIFRAHGGTKEQNKTLFIESYERTSE